MTSATFPATVGSLIRGWRERRRLSQYELAGEAEISARHLSFIETNRSTPSREVIARLSERLEVPLSERNTLLLAAGYAPMYSAARLDSPNMEPIRNILAHLVNTPIPTVIVDRGWDLIEMNAAARILVEGVAEHLLTPPVNVLRVALHPDGMAKRIRNFDEWCDHLLDRLAREARFSGSARLHALYEELKNLTDSRGTTDARPNEPAVPLRLDHNGEELTFIGTVTTFGTPVDVTVSEIMIESFFPANDLARALVMDLAKEHTALPRA